MIRLNRNQLLEIAQVLVLANTPLALFKGLVRSSAVQILRAKCSPEELVEYYDSITARARRTEIVMALAYAVLSAILLRARDAKEIHVDATRLLWGEQIRDYVARVAVSTNVVQIVQKTPSPRVHAVSSSSEDTPISLVDPHGQPLSWRNNS
jgi:hypothetical protein